MIQAVLALESGGENASVALWYRGHLTHATAAAGQSHSSRLLPIAQELLRDAGIGWSALDGIAVGIGPGSFTGLRVACGIAQGLAMASDQKLLPVNSFDLAAFVWWDSLSAVQRTQYGSPAIARFEISFDARLGERFAATVELEDDGQHVMLRFVSPPEVVLANAEDAASDAVTPSQEQVGPTSAIILRDPDLSRIGESALPAAAWIARFAAEPKLARQYQWVRPSGLQPLYVRHKVAQTIAERRQVADLVWAEMTPADVASVMVIERQAYPFPWTSGNFLDSLKAGYTMRVLKERGVMIGYLVWMRVVDEAHLLNIALSPARQGRGLGAWMMRQFMDQVGAAGIDQVLLEVRPSNTSAIGLYRRLGFQEIGQRKGYYPNSAVDASSSAREDAIVMRKTGLHRFTEGQHV